MSNDLINKRDTPLDYFIAVAMRGDDKYKRWPLPEMIAGQDEITSLRERLEQAERQRAHWRLAALMSRREGFRAGIEAAAKWLETVPQELQDRQIIVRNIRALAAQKGDE